MTRPIGVERGRASQGGYEGIAAVMDQAHAYGRALEMPAQFSTKERQRQPQAADIELFREVRKLVIQFQLKSDLEKLPNRDRLSTHGQFIDTLVRAWDTHLPDIPGPEGLRRVNDADLRRIPRIGPDAVAQIRELYPFTDEPPVENPAAPDPSKIGAMVRGAREDGYPGVANLLTIAWVLAEQQREKPEQVHQKLVEVVRDSLVHSQLMEAGLPNGTANFVVRSIGEGTFPKIFDASELSRIPDEVFWDINGLGEGQIKAIRAKFPFVR